MIAVYPAGVPLSYFVVLFSLRFELNPSEAALARDGGGPAIEPAAAAGPSAPPKSGSPAAAGPAAGPGTPQRRSPDLVAAKRAELREAALEGARLEHRARHEDRVAMVSFLVEEYEPRCYLFSVFECLRRIAMTGGLTIFADGGALQIAAGLFVAIVSHRVYSAYEPYISDDDDVLSEVAQTQLVFTFFGSLLLYVEANTEGERGYAGDVFGVIMLLVMLSGFFSACYFVLLDALGREKTRQLQRDFELRMSSSVAAARTSIHELFSDDSAAAVKAPPS